MYMQSDLIHKVCHMFTSRKHGGGRFIEMCFVYKINYPIMGSSLFMGNEGIPNWLG